MPTRKYHATENPCLTLARELTRRCRANSAITPPPISSSAPGPAVHIPRSVEPTHSYRPRQSIPPRPTVEDELESLAREYGSSVSSSTPSDEEPHSKGDVDQYPIIMEVHEHNPERRFVIVPEFANDEYSSSGDDKKNNKRSDGQEQQRDEATDGSRHKDRSREHSSSKEPYPKEVPSLANNYRDDKRRRETADISRYGLERRKSQQHVPSIDTKMGHKREPQHHRTQSAATGQRPDYFSPRQHSSFGGDSLLSPDVIQYGSKGREKTYRGANRSSADYSSRSPSRVSKSDTNSRDVPPDYYGRDRGDRTPSSSRRSTIDVEAGKPTRAMSNDVDPRYRNSYSPGKIDGRDDLKDAYTRSEEGRSKTSSSARSSRDPSRSGDEYSKSPRAPSYGTPKPVVIQNSQSSLSADRTSGSTAAHARSPSRTSTFPMAAGIATVAHEASSKSRDEDYKTTPRASEKPKESTKSSLPYPDDDDEGPFGGVGLGIQSSSNPQANQQTSKPASDTPSAFVPKPEPSPALSPGPGRTFEVGNAASAASASQSWQPPPFDPSKDGVKVERPVGSYRRYSENRASDGNDTLPDCPRQEPVAGKVDWLTLPHTSFNICPTCYDNVFSESDYRTHFKPMLRPTDVAISCDFGSSPWYRIAWLLTVKDQMPDLRLFQQLYNVGSASNREPCPGAKKATRSWLTVKDPYTRRPVPEFAVCYQCARSVELLLPNLTGVFEPLDSRPKQEACALHFTPEREEFVMFFDALETTSDKALSGKQPPNTDDLARKLWLLTAGAACREDSPVRDGYWHTMQFLPQFTVCSKCFENVVKPKLGDGNVIARNFYMRAQRLPSATCQLYSSRMRDIFKRSCRRNDPKYLEEKVVERRRIEKDIYDKLVKLDGANVSSSWKEGQVEKLVDEWKKWE